MNIFETTSFEQLKKNKTKQKQKTKQNKTKQNKKTCLILWSVCTKELDRVWS